MISRPVPIRRVRSGATCLAARRLFLRVSQIDHLHRRRWQFPRHGVDEAYLYAKASYIYDTNNARSARATTTQKATSCNDLFNKINVSGGLVWDRTGA